MSSTRRLTAYPILVLALAGVASGCGAAATGVFVGLSLTGGGGDGGGRPNRPPRIESPRVVGDPYDQVAIEYLAVDGGSDPIDIAVEFSTDGGASYAPSPATECSAPASASEGVLGLATSPSPGTTHTFVWDSFLDLGCRNIPGSDLVIRITPTETGAGGLVGDPGFCSFDLLNSFIAWITTVAGGGISANALAGPVIDPNGDLVLCDITGHQIVLKRDADGGIDILAGTGFAGYNGDNLDGRSAKLNGPGAAVIDPNGADILFTDSNNHRVCRIDFSGFLTTEIGTGLPGFVDGPRSIAWLDSPSGLAIDPNGNLYVADTGNHRIRCWNREGGTITIAGVAIPSGEVRTIAGDGTGGAPVDSSPAASAVVPSPRLLAIDSQGNLFTTSRESSGSDRVRAINPSSSSRTILGSAVLANGIGTVGGGGVEFGEGMQAATADLGEVSGIAAGAGRLVLTSWNRVREIDTFGVLTTIAGDGTRGFGGVGLPRLQAQFDFTSPLVTNNVGLDPLGNVWVTMLDDVRIVNLQATDVTHSGVTIAAGTVGRITPGSDLEPYVQGKVSLSGAGQVAAGAPDLFTSGEALIADGGSDRVVSVDAVTGVIGTEAGIDGFGGYAGDGGQADVSGMRNPGGVAVDAAGNLYIADTGNHVIRFVNRQGSQKTFYSGAVVVDPGEIATIAGTGVAGNADGVSPVTAELDSPSGVSVSAAGDVYIVDTANHAVRVINMQSTNLTVGLLLVAPQSIRRVAGDWTPGLTDQVLADSGRLSGPTAIGLDPDGNLYIADTGNDRVRLVNASPSTSITVYAGTGGQQTLGPGIIDTIVGGGACPGTGDPGPAAAACLPAPRAIDTSDLTVTAGIVEGWLLVSAGSQIRAINTGSTPDPATIGGVAVFVGEIDAIGGTGQPASSGDGGAALAAEILDPAGIAWDAASGLLLVQEPSGLRAINLSASPVGIGSVLISPDEIDTVVGTPVGPPPLRISDPGPLLVDPSGDILVADGGKLIYRFDRSTGTLSRIAGDGAQEGYAGDGGPASGSRIARPGDLALDPLGDLLYIADTGNSALRVVNLGTTGTTVAGVVVGPGEIETLADAADNLQTPVSLAVDASSGDIYVADRSARFIFEVDAITGIVTTVAGSGASPSGGDGSPAINAEIGEPRAIAVDDRGVLYVIDSGYSVGGARVRAVNLTGSQVTLFPGTTSEVLLADGDIDVLTGLGLPLSQADYIDAVDLALPAPYPDEILLAPSEIQPGQFDLFYTHEGGGSRVRKIDAVTGLVTTAAGIFGVSGFNGDGLPGPMAELNGPTGLAWFTDVNGKLLMVVSDTKNRRIRRFAP